MKILIPICLSPIPTTSQPPSSSTVLKPARLAQSVERETLKSTCSDAISRLRVRPPHWAFPIQALGRDIKSAGSFFAPLTKFFTTYCLPILSRLHIPKFIILCATRNSFTQQLPSILFLQIQLRFSWSVRACLHVAAE